MRAHHLLALMAVALGAIWGTIFAVARLPPEAVIAIAAGVLAWSCGRMPAALRAEDGRC